MNNEKTTTNDNGQHLSKKERRSLKKEQKRINKEKEIRKKRLVKWGVICATVVLLIGGFFIFKKPKTEISDDTPKIELASRIHKFGRVSASEGVVEAAFEVKNAGKSVLTISGMETSCGCTTARLDVNDQSEGPMFGMHNNPTDWSASLEPDEVAKLLVFYDPSFHENTFGSITRTVSIFSDDPAKSETKVTITLNQVK